MDGFTSLPTDILELSINNVLDPASKWGAYNSAHTYAQAFTQGANGTAKFHIADTFYGDNTGSLQVSVYEGFAGITGENGCVTFQNVPFGTYTAGEIMQDNWTNVSGLGEVKVSKNNNKFTVVNKFEPKYTDMSETITITGNTLTSATGTGWFFSGTPFAFLPGNQSIGIGSLSAGPVSSDPASKFIATYQGFWPVKTLKTIAYDFKIASNTAADYDDFYLNVYANFGSSSPTKFYDCRYDIVPGTGSLSTFTTLTFNTTDGGKLVKEAVLGTCPATLAEMETVSPGAVVRAIAINMGQSNDSDLGVAGYFDNVVVKTQDDTLYQKKTTIFDFEPVRVVEPETERLTACKVDEEENAVAGWPMIFTNGEEEELLFTEKDGCVTYTVDPEDGPWDISEGSPEVRYDWSYEDHWVSDEGEAGYIDETPVCRFFGELPKRETLLDKAIALFDLSEDESEDEYRCVFMNDIDDEYTETISGFKWNDLNGNGVRENNEPLLPNWTINLYEGANLVATATTSNIGTYSFIVEPGEYRVSEVQQSGWTQTGTRQNNVTLASTTTSCEFDVYNPEWSSYSSEANLENDDAPYKPVYTCDFGNRQNEVITEEPEEPTRNSRSSGTRTRAPQGQVLGATTQCGLWLEDYMQKATENDTYQVLKLQVFLNLQGFATPLTGIFGTTTEANVKLFQTKYFDEIIKPWFERGIVPHNRPTGFVYKTTRWKINDIMCPGIEPYPSFDGENLQTNVLLSR
jgi:hypothetical protein